MMEQARVTLQKCGGLPLAITTIGGFLATKPKTAIEWRKMNNSISTELEINPELMTIKSILMRSYDGLPYHLKSAFLYLSIFPEDFRIRWGRLVRRWIAEGYSRDMHGVTGAELCRRYIVELLDRSMILPGEGMGQYKYKIRSCQLHDMIREICISKAREENLVFMLEDGCCLSDTQGTIRHLVIGSNWKRDKDVLESLDLSHVRSLTVFGEWRSFFISNNMRFLRVLDLEDTVGLRDHHLDKIGQLRHLKYLSLRGVKTILCLPNSLRNLRHLQTLDVRNINPYAFLEMRSDGVVFPRGIGKLKALHRLGVVNVSGRNGNATLKELRKLTQLRKLKVAGISSKNNNEFWSSIAGHNQLQSLSLEAESECGHFLQLDGCLGEVLFPPSSIERLTLKGQLVNVTGWIHKLHNLTKLVLQHNQSNKDNDVIQALGLLPSLAVLRLLKKSFCNANLYFRSSSFLSLMVLEISQLDITRMVMFQEDTMPKLELLQVGNCSELNDIAGFTELESLKEIRLIGYVPAEGVVMKNVEEHVRVNIIRDY